MVVIAAVTASVRGSRDAGQPAVPARCPAFAVAPPGASTCYSPSSGCVAGAVGVVFTRVLYVDRGRCATACGADPSGCVPPSAACCSGCCCWRCRRCTASATRCSATRSPAATRSRSCWCCCVGKMVATSLTIGIGGSGGVFAPSLFIGAMLGAAFGAVARTSLPGRRPRRHLRADRDGGGLRRRRASTDHRRGDHVRAHRRVHDHLAADGRDRARHRRRAPADQATPSTPSSCGGEGSTSASARPSLRARGTSSHP